jgi:2-hydroxychromene-2-carboxylate isomerase
VDSEAPDRPVFYYDIGSAYAWLAAERINQVLPEVPIWRPIMITEIRKVHGGQSWARTGRRAAEQAEVERRARERGLMEVRWPDPWPTPTETVNLAATYAAQGGRAVAFSLAAFRQTFNAGRDMSELDNVLIAAAACELHPRAVKIGIESRSTRERLERNTQEAGDRGVRGIPTVAIGDHLFWGDDTLEDAAALLVARAD